MAGALRRGRDKQQVNRSLDHRPAPEVNISAVLGERRVQSAKGIAPSVEITAQVLLQRRLAVRNFLRKPGHI